MYAFLSGLFEPGFFSTAVVHTALIAGGAVAIVAGAVGVFTVIRSQSFTGHALSDVGATGGSAAYLVGLSPLVGFVVVAVFAGWIIELVGIRSPRGRDLAMGVALGAALGLAALFLYLDATHSSTTGATVTILFGSLFAISSGIVPAIVVLGGISLVLVLALYRRLLLSALDGDLAAARGVAVRWVGLGYLLALSLTVALTAVTIGAVLGTALLIGPSAIALRLAKRPGVAMTISAGIGLIATWLGVLLAYDSYYWPPVGHGWPVSFLVVALIFTFYLVAQLVPGRARRHEALRDEVALGTAPTGAR